MSGRYDVAIVGGGHNGLVAAAYLARAGGAWWCWNAVSWWAGAR